MSGEATGSGADSGFTLLELLVALAVSAIILGLAGEGIRYATRVSQAAAALDRMTALDAGRHALAECIEAALPLSLVDEHGQIRLAFSGTADRLDLACAAGDGTRGVRRLLLHARAEGSRVHIVLEDSQLVQRLGESGDVPAATTHLLAESVSGLAIRYFGEERDGRGARWREAWSGAEGRLPDLVGVSFRFPDGDLRRWPELIVRPRAAAQ